MSTSLTLIFCVMEDKSLWKIMIGVSNSEITNGMYPPECGHKNDGGDGTLCADIEVFIPQLTPNAKGDVTDVKSPITVEAEVTDPIEQKTMKSSVPRVQTIKCQYMGGPNFLVPCVHKGEQVWVWQYNGGNISYFWLPMGREDGLRLHEHMRWYAMNQSKSVDGNNSWSFVRDDNTYFVDINTNKGQKSIHVHTSVNDGEPHGYDIRIMPEKSRLEIVDTAGNYLFLDSANTVWEMFNIMQSFIRLDKQDITILCKHDLLINVGNNMTTIVGGDQYLKVSANRTMDIGSNEMRKIGSSLTENVPNRLITAVTSHNGNVTITGLETVTSDAIIGGKSFNAHIHGNGNLGSPTTPPIT